MGRNYDKLLVIVEQGPVQVPLGVRWSGRGGAGRDQPGANGQCAAQTELKFVRFSFVGWKKFKELFPVL